MISANLKNDDTNQLFCSIALPGTHVFSDIGIFY